jgi:serralysin
MKGLRHLAALLVFLSAILCCARASAFFHIWRFTEFFSNADGSVQFIEMFSTSSGENFAEGAQIRSTSTGKVFTFPNNLTGSTANKRLLIATPGFAMLQGAVTPDFTLPSANFFNPASDTVSLASGFTIDSRTFTALPTDGVTSRHFPANTLATNSPTNFAGGMGSVNLAAPAGPTGDYNGNGAVDAADYVVWRNTLNQTLSAGTGADGSGNGTIDNADYNFWRARFGTAPGSGSASGVPEPATAALTFVVVGLLGLHSRKRRFD